MVGHRHIPYALDRDQAAEGTKAAPRESGSWHSLGYVQHRLGQHREAIASYSRSRLHLQYAVVILRRLGHPALDDALSRLKRAKATGDQP